MVTGLQNIDKLIALIKNRPEIYDYYLREHYDPTYVKGLWDEIANEMNVSVELCKKKWMSLRYGFARELKNEQDDILCNEKNRRKWYLVDDLSFLRKCPPFRRNIMLSNSINEDSENTGVATADDDNAFMPVLFPTQSQNVNTKDNCIENSEIPFKIQSVSSQGCIADVDEIVHSAAKVKPTFEIEDSLEEYPFEKISCQEENDFENQTMTFFKSMLPDIIKLSAKNQRLYKQEVLLKLNKSLDEQEMESVLNTKL